MRTFQEFFDLAGFLIIGEIPIFEFPGTIWAGKELGPNGKVYRACDVALDIARFMHPTILAIELREKRLGVVNEAFGISRQVVASRYQCRRWREVVQDRNPRAEARDHILVFVHNFAVGRHTIAQRSDG